MNQEKSMHRELELFTKTCKDKQRLIFESFALEEKNLNEGYKASYSELLRRHKKHLKNLYKDLENKKKSLRKKLEKELSSEVKSLKKQNRAISISQLFENNGVDNSSNFSADSTRNSANQRITTITNDSGIRPHSSSNDNQPNGERQSRWALRHTKKILSKSEHSLNRVPDSGVMRLKNELEERYRCSLQDARNTIAENEWKFLLERQQLRRSFTENLGELKQRRLMALGDHSRMQIKGYFDIQRKWLSQQHSQELEQRNQTSQEALKRLGNVQSIERHTACRIAKLTAKGQKQMFRVLKVLDSKDDLNQLEDSEIQDAHGTRMRDPVFTDTLFINSAEQSPETENRMISQGIPAYASMSVLPRHVPDQNSPLSIHSRQKNQGDTDLDRRDLNLTVSTTRGVVLRKNRYKPDSKNAMRRARSAHSLQSTVSAYDTLQRTVLNVLANRQTEQWSDVLDQEHSITDMLMQSHAGQIKALIASESASLKRAQIEQDNKATYLAMTLEANQRFMEKEFEEERSRLIQFYFTSDRITGPFYSQIDQDVPAPPPPALPPPLSDTINGSSDIAISTVDQISPSISIPIDQYIEPIRRPASTLKVDKSLAVTTKLTNSNGTIEIKHNPVMNGQPTETTAN